MTACPSVWFHGGMENGEYTPKLLRELLRETPALLLDGAWGTMIAAHHPELATLPALAATRNPSLLKQIGEDYLSAGAMALTVNSFRASPWLMEKEHEDFTRVNARAVEAISALRPPAILGSIAPVVLEARLAGLRFAGDTGWQSDQFQRQAAALRDAGCRTALLETFGNLGELLLALRSCRAAGFEEVYCSCHVVLHEGVPTMSGGDETLPTCLSKLLESGADLIGVNCVNGPEEALQVLRSLPTELAAQPLAVRPNAGTPENSDDGLTHPYGPEAFGALAPQLRDAGARLIGGCCGTTPRHIAAMAESLKR